ncbi:MAG TPA: secondary thiamine-phosphate synthase enzyme YjbQ [Vicinamibacterales bacterium]|nr:secondary thiamine-phosphate synthase enzyme YjbQ [Vicinamibacterales bacterium]
MPGSNEVMPRSSSTTVRSEPAAAVTNASGPLVVKAETLTISTDKTLQLIDLTDDVMARVQELGVREGTATLSSLHTTCAVFVNESQAALREDMEHFLEHVVDPAAAWLHNDPQHSDCSRMNAGAHLRALMLSHSATLQVSGGELVMGQWQRVLMAELDGPRDRSLRLQVMGVA